MLLHLYTWTVEKTHILIIISPQQFQDDEIKKYVKEILDKANLEEITMKTVCKQVYAKYPQFDLSHKKDFIKTTVKSVSVFEWIVLLVLIWKNHHQRQ